MAKKRASKKSDNIGQTTLDSPRSREKKKKKQTQKKKADPSKGRSDKRKKQKKSESSKQKEGAKAPTLLEKYQKNLAIYRDMDYREGEGETHLLMGKEYFRTGNLTRAEFHTTKGMELYQELELFEELAEAFQIMGDVKARMGSPVSLEDYERAVDLLDELGKLTEKRSILVKMGGEHLRHGAAREALEKYREAQDIRKGQDLLLSMGRCHEKMGEVDKAIELYRNSLDSFTDGERSEALVRIGDLYFHQKKREALAEDAYRQAGEIPGFKNRSRAQFRLGEFYFKKKDYEKALDYLKKALENSEKASDKKKVHEIQLRLCELFHILNLEEEALRIYKRMLKHLPSKEKPDILNRTISIYRKLGQDDHLLKALKERAVIHSAQGQMADLLDSYRQMEEIYRKTAAAGKLLETYQEIARSAGELEDRRLEAEYNNKIERYYMEKGHVNKHKDFYEEMEKYYYGLGDPSAAIYFFEKNWELHREKALAEFQARDAMNLGKLSMSRADYIKAEDWFKSGLLLYGGLKDRNMQGVARVFLGGILKSRGLYGDAIKSYVDGKRHFKASGDKTAELKINTYIETIYDLEARVVHDERAHIIEGISKLNGKVTGLETKNKALGDKIKNMNSLLVDTDQESLELKETIKKMKEDLVKTRSEKKQTSIKAQLRTMEKKLMKNRDTRLRLKKELRESEDGILSNEHSMQKHQNEIHRLEKDSAVLKKKAQKWEDMALACHIKGRDKGPLVSSLTKLEELEAEIYSHLAQGKVPAMTFPTRTKTNIEFDDRSRVYKLGSLTTNRTAKTVSGANMLLRTSHVIDFIRSMIDSTFKGKPRSSTLREMYYISESWGKLGKFDSQDGSNQVIEDLEVVTKWMREHFKLRPEEDGARVIGDLTLREKNRKGKWKNINCKDDVGDSGYTIPYNVEMDKLEFKKVRANFVMAIETGGMFDRLVENGFDEAYNCVLVHIKGQPARSTRRFIKRLSEEQRLPVYCFTDGDPWSYRIYASIAYGAIKTAHISEYLATPTTEYIGITPSDIKRYDLPTDKLSSQDVSALKAELSDPRFQDRFWQGEIEAQLKMGKKSEQQALAKYGLDFVTDTYLPEKLEEMESDIIF